MVWDDQDIEEAAQRFLMLRGDEAEERARLRASDLSTSRESELEVVWTRIADAIARLQDESPHDGWSEGETSPTIIL